jgi:hypothetical protein
MAEENGGGGFSIPWPTVFTLVALAGGVFFFLPPLSSSRPGGAPGQSSAMLGFQDADARLWEDPVKAALRHRAHFDAMLEQSPNDEQAKKELELRIRGERELHSIAHLRKQINGLYTAGEPVLILPVMIEGGSYPENSEARLRSRHAVLCALSMADLTPDDGEHLGYVQVNWPRRISPDARPAALSRVDASEPALVIPFEWCSYGRPPLAPTTRAAPIAGAESAGSPAPPPSAPTAAVPTTPPDATDDRDPSIEHPVSATVELAQATGRVGRPSGARPRVYSPRAAVPPDVGEYLKQRSRIRTDQMPPRPEQSQPDRADPPQATTRQSPQTRPGTAATTRAASPGKRLRVLVMWLEDSAFADFPLRRISQLLQAIDPTRGEAPPLPEAQAITLRPPSVTVLGPRSSGTLRSLVREAFAGGPAAPDEHTKLGLRGVTMYSATATVDDDLLLETLTAGDSSGGRIPLGAWVAGRVPELALRRSIAPDGRLCQSLVEELWRRGIHAGFDDVALVSEWDTLYGRSIPLSFAAAVHSKWPRSPERRGPLDYLTWGNLWPENITRVSYLRGIDGRIPGEQPDAKDSGADQGDSPAGAQLIRPGERSVGTDQSDYLRRLIRDLEMLDLRSKAQGRNGLRAIGVMGSDVYDKLMVLRALRPRFPSAVFFTTDLDARLFYPKDWKDTHNLVVASAFGLSLDQEYQGNLAPFRDSYQTALYASTLHALGLLSADPELAAPRLFEIGRGGPVDLTVRTRGSKSHHHGDPEPLGELTLHPRHTSWWSRIPLNPHRKLSLALLIGAAGALAGAAWVHRQRTDADRLPRGPIWPYAAFAAASLLGALLLLFFRDGDRGEPLSLVGGVSVWPTQLLRWLAILLCVHFLVKAARQLWASDVALAREFALPRRHRDTLSPRRRQWWVQRWREFRQSLSGRHWPTTASVCNLWENFVRHSWMRNRWARALPRALIVFGLTLWMMRSFSPLWVPYRGWAARYTDRFLEYAAIFAVILLIFFVADETRLCVRLIRGLRSSAWEERSRKKWADRRGVDPAHVEEFLDVQLIARRTEVAAGLVLWPFLVVALLVISRLSYFDNWDWPLAVVIVFAAMCLYSYYIGLKVRTAAAGARDHAVKKLEHHLAACSDETTCDKIRALIDSVRNERRGAFSTLSQHPVVATILLPSGGLGIWALLEYLSKVQ